MAGSGIAANGATIEISGGLVQASSVMPQDSLSYGFTSAVGVSNSLVRISGGVLSGGMREPNRFIRGMDYVALRSLSSVVEITGGEFQGSVQLIGSRTRISGGNFPFFGPFLGIIRPQNGFALILGPQTPEEALPFPGCTEIHGGRFASISVVGPDEQLFVFGKFQVPLGPFVSTLGLDVEFADGTQVILPLRGRAVLRAPGEPGCDGL